MEKLSTLALRRSLANMSLSSGAGGASLWLSHSSKQLPGGGGGREGSGSGVGGGGISARTPRRRRSLGRARSLPLRSTPHPPWLTLLDGLLDVVVHPQRGARVKVAAQLERLDHGLAGGHVRQDAQLQLAVIGHNQRLARGHVGHKRLAHLVGRCGGGGSERDAVMQTGTQVLACTDWDELEHTRTL